MFFRLEETANPPALGSQQELGQTIRASVARPKTPLSAHERQLMFTTES